MSICPKNKSSKARRDKRRANWKMAAPNLVKCSKCGALMIAAAMAVPAAFKKVRRVISSDITKPLLFTQEIIKYKSG